VLVKTVAMESSFFAFLTDSMNPLMQTPFIFTDYSQKSIKDLATMDTQPAGLKQLLTYSWL